MAGGSDGYQVFKPQPYSNINCPLLFGNTYEQRQAVKCGPAGRKYICDFFRYFISLYYFLRGRGRGRGRGGALFLFMKSSTDDKPLNKNIYIYIEISRPKFNDVSSTSQICCNPINRMASLITRYTSWCIYIYRYERGNLVEREFGLSFDEK